MNKLLIIHLTLVLWAALQVAAQDGTTTTEPPDEIVYYDCGGDVELQLDQAIQIQFKVNQQISRNERCIWMIKSDQKRYYTVKLTLISHGFSEGMGIAFYTVDPERSNLSSYVIGMDAEYEILLHPFTFLSFYSGTAYQLGKGFNARLQLTIREEIEVENVLPKTKMASLSTWHDFYRHPVNTSSQYEKNERVYVVINPPNPNREYYRLVVDFMDILKCGNTCDCDRLDVYRITGVNGYYGNVRLCGDNANGTIVPSKSFDPILFIFHSQVNSTMGTGFQVTWEQHN